MRYDPADYGVSPDEASLDRRHVLLLNAWASCGPFAHALEIGSWRGYSSSALVHACHEGRLGDVTFCDTRLTSSVHSLSRLLGAKGFAAWIPSVELLARGFGYDFVFVDGDHSLATVAEEARHLLAVRPLCVVAHDTAHMEGPAYLKRCFQADPDYLCLEEAEPRGGERTERGLFLACRGLDLYKKAKQVYKFWADRDAP